MAELILIRSPIIYVLFISVIGYFLSKIVHALVSKISGGLLPKFIFWISWWAFLSYAIFSTPIFSGVLGLSSAGLFSDQFLILKIIYAMFLLFFSHCYGFVFQTALESLGGLIFKRAEGQKIGVSESKATSSGRPKLMSVLLVIYTAISLWLSWA